MDDGGIAELGEAIESRPCRLAYVTGRHLALALDGIELHRLPRPDTLVCDVGTSVYSREGTDYEPDPGYRALMVAALGGLDAESIRHRLSRLDGLRPQEAEKQAEFKVSFYSPSGPEGEDVARRAAELLRGAEGAVNVVYSVDSVKDRGLIDVLPAGVAKDTAVRYLHDASGLADDHLVYAGDSGNDRAAMLSGFNVVVVGNATERFKESIELQAEGLGLAARVYVADGLYARGVLEGCRHFGIL